MHRRKVSRIFRADGHDDQIWQYRLEVILKTAALRRAVELILVLQRLLTRQRIGFAIAHEHNKWFACRHIESLRKQRAQQLPKGSE